MGLNAKYILPADSSWRSVFQLNSHDRSLTIQSGNCKALACSSLITRSFLQRMTPPAQGGCYNIQRCLARLSHTIYLEHQSEFRERETLRVVGSSSDATRRVVRGPAKDHQFARAMPPEAFPLACQRGKSSRSSPIRCYHLNVSSPAKPGRVEKAALLARSLIQLFSLRLPNFQGCAAYRQQTITV